MSFTFESHEHGVDTFGLDTRVTTMISIQELDETESNALLSGLDIGTLSPSMLRSPPEYVVSDSDEDDDINPCSTVLSDSDHESEDGDNKENWFPSLLHQSLIEFLEDGDDDVMVDHDHDELVSTNMAEIIEVCSDAPPRTMSPRKRLYDKSVDSDDEEEQEEVVHVFI